MWLSMLEPYINNYLVRVMLVFVWISRITYPQWLPAVKRNGGEIEMKKLVKLLLICLFTMQYLIHP